MEETHTRANKHTLARRFVRSTLTHVRRTYSAGAAPASARPLAAMATASPSPPQHRKKKQTVSSSHTVASSPYSVVLVHFLHSYAVARTLRSSVCVCAKTVELVAALFRLLKVSQLHRADERWRVKTLLSCSIRRWQLRHSVTLSSLARWAVYSETCETTHLTLSKLLSQAGGGTRRHAEARPWIHAHAPSQAIT